MVTSATITVPREIRAADGEICAYFLPAAEVDRMRAEIESLREQAAELERQRDSYVAELTEVLKTYIPIPPTEEELLAAKPNSDEVLAIVASIETR